jgi:hypothetical protein
MKLKAARRVYPRVTFAKLASTAQKNERGPLREEVLMTAHDAGHSPLRKRVLSEPSTWLGRLVLGGIILYSALVAFYLVVFRLQMRRLNDAMCVFNKHVLNPVMMFVDRPHLYAAISTEGRST